MSLLILSDLFMLKKKNAVDKLRELIGKQRTHVQLICYKKLFYVNQKLKVLSQIL